MLNIFLMLSLAMVTNFSLEEGNPTAKAATQLIQLLSSQQRNECQFEFEDPQRTHWRFLPGNRAGLPLREMSARQQQAVHEVLGTVLSEQGMEDLKGMYAMEVALQEAARAKGREDPSRDPDQYEWAIFGSPGNAPWTWHFEGHHLSLNFTHVDDEITVTPLFIGVAPFRIPAGTHQGMTVLGDEREAAFEFLRSLDNDQRSRAILSDQAPGDVVTGPGREDRIKNPEGLRLGDLSPEQQRAAMELLRRYADVLRVETARAEISRIEAAGLDNIHFAWIGKIEPDQPHYWRLHGPTFLLEYDCVGGDPNHVHMVWHDPSRNFGADPLQRHHRAHHAEGIDEPK